MPERMGTMVHNIRLGMRAARAFVRDGKIDPLPVRHAFAGYTAGKAGRDLKAAIDVALVGLPQGMAFAAMAGLDSIYGIMAATVGTFIAPLFTRCSLTVSGPSNATAFMLASFFLAASPAVQANPAVYVPIIVFMAGLMCVLGAFVKATEMLQFVSRSVLVGYITGAATLIIASQLRYVLGIHDVLRDSGESGQGAMATHRAGRLFLCAVYPAEKAFSISADVCGDPGGDERGQPAAVPAGAGRGVLRGAHAEGFHDERPHLPAAGF